MQSFLDTLKALSDRTRLRILLLLPGRELCLGQIMATLEISPSTVSKHVSVLKSTGLVTDRKSGKWVYCSISRNPERALQELLSLIVREISESPDVIEDRRKLQKILEFSPETLCERFRVRNHISGTV